MVVNEREHMQTDKIKGKKTGSVFDQSRNGSFFGRLCTYDQMTVSVTYVLDVQSKTIYDILAFCAQNISTGR